MADYPKCPVRILVPLPQGGPADILARIVAGKLAAKWGVAVTVENTVGNDTIDGTLAVAKSAPDGHTLLVVPSQFTVHPRTRRDLPYDVVKDFAPVIMMALSPNVLVVHPSVEAKTIDELIAHARRHPGKVRYATGGPGSTSHVSAERLRASAGIDIVPVHCKGEIGRAHV